MSEIATFSESKMQGSQSSKIISKQFYYEEAIKHYLKKKHELDSDRILIILSACSPF